MAFATYHFAVNLQPSVNTQRISCAVVKVYEGKVIDRQYLSPDQFVLQAQGIMSSKANPEGRDLIAEYEIESCVSMLDSIEDVYVVQCNPIDNLWKLRYKSDPDMGIGAGEAGWSNRELAPSDGQLQMLSQYGIRHVTHFAWGENAFQLLKDVANPAWVANYRGL